MKIADIRLINFLPFRGDTKVSFPADPIVNTTIFFGENTKGKTSILHAFRWVLYGAVIEKGVKLGYVNLLNFAARDTGETIVAVELRFDHEAKTYWLRREMKSSDDGDLGFLQMQIDGQPVSSSQAVREIERIAPNETQRFFLFDGELLREYEELMIPSNHTAKKIKEAIEDVMGFPSLLKAQTVGERVKKKLALESRSERSTNDALVLLKTKRDDLEEKLRLKETEHISINESYEKGRLDEKDLNARIGSHTKQKTKYDELRYSQTNLENLKRQCSDKDTSLAGLRKDAWKSILKNLVHSRAEKSRKLTAERSGLDSDLRSREQMKSSILEIESTGQCPTCGGTHNNGARLQEKVRSIDIQIQDITAKLESKSEVNPLWQSLEEKFSDASLEKDLRNSELEKQRLLMERESESRKIKGLLEELTGFDGDEADRLIGMKAKLTINLQNLLDESQNLEKQLTQFKSESLRVQQEIGKLSVVGEVTKESQLLLVKEVLQLIDRAKDTLRDRIKQQVEDAATKAFIAMTNRPEDYKSLRITEGYGLEILAEDGRVIPKRSAGAEQVVALALIDGLNNVGSSPGPVIMDTPFGRLDLTHRKNIMTYMPKSASQFIVFTHSGELDQGSPVLDAVMPFVGRRYRIESTNAWESKILEM